MKRRKNEGIGAFLIGLFILLGAAGALAAAPAGGQLAGTAGALSGCVTAYGKPVAGAEVTATKLSGVASYRSVTDHSGHYGFSQLSPGVYKITISDSGLMTLLYPRVPVRANQAETLNAGLRVGPPGMQITISHAPVTTRKLSEAGASPATQSAKPRWKSTAEYDAFEAFYNEKDAQKQLARIQVFLRDYPVSDFRYLAYVAEMHAYAELGKVAQSDKAAVLAVKADPGHSDPMADVQALSELAGDSPYTYDAAASDADTQLSHAVAQAELGLSLLRKVSKPTNYTDQDFREFVNSSRAAFHTAIGFARLQQQHYPDAIAMLKAATQDDPSNALSNSQIYLWLGEAYYNPQSQNLDKAIPYFARALILARQSNSPNLPETKRFFNDTYQMRYGSTKGEDQLLAEAQASLSASAQAGPSGSAPETAVAPQPQQAAPATQSAPSSAGAASAPTPMPGSSAAQVYSEQDGRVVVKTPCEPSHGGLQSDRSSKSETWNFYCSKTGDTESVTSAPVPQSADPHSQIAVFLKDSARAGGPFTIQEHGAVNQSALRPGVTEYFVIFSGTAHFGSASVPLLGAVVVADEGDVRYLVLLDCEEAGRSSNADVFEKEEAENFIGSVDFPPGATAHSQGACAEQLAVNQRAVDANQQDEPAWVKLGKAYHCLGKYQDEIGAEKHALQLDAKDSNAWFRLGVAYLSSEQYGNAVTALQNAARIDPGEETIWLDLGDAYGLVDEYQQAVSAEEKAIRLDPNNDAAWTTLGEARIALRQYSPAEDALEKATKLNPKDEEAWRQLGVAYGHTGKVTLAVNAEERATRLAPGDNDAWHDLGIAYCLQHDKAGLLKVHSVLKQREPKLAAKFYKTCIAPLQPAAQDAPENQSPGAVAPQTQPETESHQEGKYQQQVQAAQQAVRTNPNDAHAWDRLGGAYLLLREYQKMADAENRAVQIDPSDAAFWTNLGSAEYKLGQYGKAVETEKHAIRLNPNLAGSWVTLGYAYRGLNDEQSFLKAEKRAVQINPEDPTALNGLGAAYDGLGQPKTAIEQFQRTLRLNPNPRQTAKAWDGLIVSYMSLGDATHAIAATRKAILTDSNDSFAWMVMGMLWCMRPHTDQPQRIYQILLKIDPAKAAMLYKKCPSLQKQP